MPDDRILVQETMRGSEAAMEVLIRKYYKSIFAYVYRNVGDKEIAYDLTQEIFIKVIKKITEYTNKGSFKSWLYAIAVNHCRDYWKSLDYRMTCRQLELADHLSNEHDDVSFIFERNETRQQVKAAIQQLPELQKEVVLLRYYHDLKIKEIAEITSANESTVKTRLRQGLHKLQMLFAKGEEENEERWVWKK
jgi:RNA polymerase sigma factor (sigma-70 family)